MKTVAAMARASLNAGLSTMRQLYRVDGKVWTVAELAAALGLSDADMRARLRAVSRIGRPPTMADLR